MENKGEIIFGRRFEDSIENNEIHDLKEQFDQIKQTDVLKIVLKLQHDLNEAYHNIFILENKLIHEKYTDKLTGALSKEGLKNSLQLNINRLNKSGITFSAVMIDIKKFKEINETKGYMFGDDVLKNIVQYFSSSLREGDSITYLKTDNVNEVGNKDNRDKSNIARFGGDEFVILLESANKEAALQVTQRLDNKAQEVISTTTEDNPMHYLNFRYAINEWGPEDDIDTFFKGMDIEMFESKRSE